MCHLLSECVYLCSHRGLGDFHCSYDSCLFADRNASSILGSELFVDSFGFFCRFAFLWD